MSKASRLKEAIPPAFCLNLEKLSICLLGVSRASWKSWCQLSSSNAEQSESRLRTEPRSPVSKKLAARLLSKFRNSEQSLGLGRAVGSLTTPKSEKLVSTCHPGSMNLLPKSPLRESWEINTRIWERETRGSRAPGRRSWPLAYLPSRSPQERPHSHLSRASPRGLPYRDGERRTPAGAAEQPGSQRPPLSLRPLRLAVPLQTLAYQLT